MKAVSLPINILVIIAIAVIVLLGLIAMYFTGFGPFTTAVSLEGVKNEACRELVQQYRCDRDLDDILTDNFDVAGDGDSANDNLESLCSIHFNLDAAGCKQMCGCPSVPT
jgi:hypothetical protein